MASPKAIARFMALAKKASLNATYPRQHIGAVMVVGTKVIAVGYNTAKTNPIQHHYNKFRFEADCLNNGVVHAETMLLLKTKYLDVDWAKISVYIYREFKDGTPALAKPCMACQVALEERGIKNIYYSSPDGVKKL